MMYSIVVRAMAYGVHAIADVGRVDHQGLSRHTSTLNILLLLLLLLLLYHTCPPAA